MRHERDMSSRLVQLAAIIVTATTSVCHANSGKSHGHGTFHAVFLQGFVAGGAGLVVYGVIAYLLKTEELFTILNGLRKRIWKKARPEEALGTESPTAS